MLPKRGQPIYGWPLYGWPLWPILSPFFVRFSHSTSEVYISDCKLREPTQFAISLELVYNSDIKLRDVTQSTTSTQPVMSMKGETNGV